MKKNAFLLIALLLIVKIFGFARELTLAYFHGVSNITDIYIIAIMLPNIFMIFFDRTIKNVLIPKYAEIKAKKDKQSADYFTSNILNILIIIILAVAIVIVIFARPTISIIASGFEGEDLEIAVRFIRITIFSIIFMGMASVFTAFLHIKNNLWLPAVATIPMQLLLIISIGISSQTNVMLLAYGFLVASSTRTLIMLVGVIKHKFSYRPTLSVRDNEIISFMFLVWPILLSVAVNDINKIIDRTIASQIVVGGISALNYASKLNQFIQGVIVLAITTSVFPVISRMAMTNDIKSLKVSIQEAISLIWILVIPASVGSMLFSSEIIKLLFGRGEFGDTATQLTATALFFYSIGMLGFGMRTILNKAFYALKETKIPFYNALLAVLINVTLNLLFLFFTDLGIGGLALATSISGISSSLFLLIRLNMKIGYFFNKAIILKFIKILLSTFFMAVISYYSYIILNKITAYDQNLITVVAILIGAGIYVLTLTILKVDEMFQLIGLFKKKMRL